MNRRKLHNYLGIELDYCEELIVRVSMIKYINSILSEFPENVGTPGS